MASAFVDALFLVGLVLPPAVVVIGALLLVWPSGSRTTARSAVARAHAH